MSFLTFSEPLFQLVVEVEDSVLTFILVRLRTALIRQVAGVESELDVYDQTHGAGPAVLGAEFDVRSQLCDVHAVVRCQQRNLILHGAFRETLRKKKEGHMLTWH